MGTHFAKCRPRQREMAHQFFGCSKVNHCGFVAKHLFDFVQLHNSYAYNHRIPNTVCRNFRRRQLLKSSRTGQDTTLVLEGATIQDARLDARFAVSSRNSIAGPIFIA